MLPDRSSHDAAGAAPEPPAHQRGLDLQLTAELEQLARVGQRRDLDTASGLERRFDFTSNDYLGLAGDPRVVAAARAALEAHGAGGRAARLLGGGAGLRELEAAAARWLGSEAALSFPTGYQANVGLITSLAGADDVLFSDALNHASLIDGMRLTPARRVVFGHRDLASLDAALERSRDARRRLIVTESVFSMDGDRADLAGLAALARRHDAWLLVDEAHAAGVLGLHGEGLAFDLAREPDSRVLARMVTGGKALGNAGALVAGSRATIDLLLNRARAFIFTTAPPPSLTAGLLAAIEILSAAEDPGRPARAAAERLASRLGLAAPGAAIVPVPVADRPVPHSEQTEPPATGDGDAAIALAAAAALVARGFDVRAVRPPTVPAGTSRLRIVCHAWQGAAEVDALGAAIEDILGEREAAAPEPPQPAPVAQPRSPTVFVAGTDTDVGKTVVAALICRAYKQAGSVHYWKPVQTGADSDTQTIAELAGLDAFELERPAWQLERPASPHEAAAAEGLELKPERIFGALDALRRLLAPTPLVVELAGGLCVPYTTPGEAPPSTQLDWLARERPPFVLVARSGLGTLNHTMLSLGALAERHLWPAALFLVGPRHASNLATLRAWSGLTVHELPELAPLSGAALDHWLAAEPLTWLPSAP